MFHLAILRADEYRRIQEDRKEKRFQRQRVAEEKYCYPQEKQAELLKQRNLTNELKSLKRRKIGVMLSLWALSMVFAWGCGRMIKTEQNKKATTYLGISTVIAIAAGFKRNSYIRRIRMKNEEILCAKHGWICPRLELYRQEGKIYR